MDGRRVGFQVWGAAAFDSGAELAGALGDFGLALGGVGVAGGEGEQVVGRETGCVGDGAAVVDLGVRVFGHCRGLWLGLRSGPWTAR